MSNLREDVLGNKIQGFAPRKVITITATTAWTPDTIQDQAFRVNVASNYYMDSDSGHEAGLIAGSITVINKTIGTYTFDTTQEIEVM